MRVKKIRVLIGRFTLDGHDRGILTVISALKNAGIEVVFIHFNNPLEIAKSAIQEGVDVIGLTSSMGEHLLTCSVLMEELRKSKVDIPVIVGGVIPTADLSKLAEMGINKVFGPGSKPEEAVSFISQISPRNSQIRKG